MLRVKTATKVLLALFAVGVLAADETLTTAVYDAVVPFQTSCDLKVVGSGGDVYNGAVQFLKGGKEVLYVGLQPQWEGGSLAINNDVFKRGEKSWYDYQWLKIKYPVGDGDNKRVYTFEFWDAKLIIICQGRVLISIPYNELTTDKAGFLSGIDSIILNLEGEAELKFAKLCSVSAERPPLPTLILYDNANQQGTAVTVHGATPVFGDINFNDKTGSVMAVTGDWELYPETTYKGQMFFVAEGGTLNAKQDNAYSSARPANCRYISDQTTAKLRVYPSTHLQGEKKMYLNPQADLGDWSNKINSAIADKGDWELYKNNGYMMDRIVIKEGETVERLSFKPSSLRPICETYKGKEKCALQRVEVLDKEGDLEPKHTGTEIIGSQSSGSCYGPAEHEIEITQTNSVEESVSLEISKENEKNWNVGVSASVEVSVGFMGTGSSFSAGVSMGAGGSVTMGSSKTTETTNVSEKEHKQVTQFAVPGAGIVFGIVDRYEIDQSNLPVKIHMMCPDGTSKTVDSFIAMKQVSFGAAHFWSLTGQFTQEACRADGDIPDCVENVRKNYANFIGQKTEIENAFI